MSTPGASGRRTLAETPAADTVPTDDSSPLCERPVFLKRRKQAMSHSVSADGQQILITGGTSGVGLETARLLVAAGANVTIVGSDPMKGRQAEQSLNAGDTSRGGATFVAADLSSIDQVRQLARTIKDRLDRLDVLINNAGLVTTNRVETVDGFETTFAVNYLAAFVFTTKLLPLLERSAPARVLSLTAAVEPIGRLPFDDLQRQRHFGGLRAYAQSKRAVAMYTIELARRLKAKRSGVTANVVDPFLVRTSLTSAKDVPLLFKLARPMMIRPTTSARWVARAAADPRFSRTTGRHFMFGHRVPSPPGSRSRRRAGRLWSASLELTSKEQDVIDR
jgi:NAD(P)-dependent dehydrogenase (short-subunit alcohol dehydrogenase family)